MKERISPWKNLYQRLEDTLTLVELTEQDIDKNVERELSEEVEILKKEFADLQLTSLFTSEYDTHNAILSIHAGAGGTEACDWVDILLRMYTRWAERQGYKVQVVDFTPGEEVGTRSITLIISGLYAYGKLKAEKGVHRLVRISPFDANKRRHTTFAAVDVIPEIEDEIKIDLNPDDLRIDTFRASGAGGQHVNKTSSAVRITHIPTGIVVTSQSERSQHKNKAIALKVLKAKLHKRLIEEKKEKIEELRGDTPDIAWGSQIRSYIFHPYSLIKDHRTNKEEGNVKKVMDGEIDEFITAYLKKMPHFLF